jgi:hypothetical protein
MDLTEITMKGVYWIQLAPDRDRWWAVAKPFVAVSSRIFSLYVSIKQTIRQKI